MTPVRVAVVGLGYWGPQLVRNLYESAEAELAVICDARPEALAPLARRYPGVAQTHGLRRGARRPDHRGRRPRHADQHALPTRARRARGRQAHIRREATRRVAPRRRAKLARLARELGLVLMPGHTFLYSPPVHAIRDLITAGELGDIYFISTSRVNLGLHQSDASVVWDLGPHDFSILTYWLDERPRSVTALSRGCVMPDTPDVAFIQLEYASGVIANVELAWLAPSKLRRTTIVGSQKMVVYDDTSAEPVRVFDSGVNLPDPVQLRRVPTDLPNGRHRLAPGHGRRASRARARRSLQRDSHGLDVALDGRNWVSTSSASSRRQSARSPRMEHGCAFSTPRNRQLFALPGQATGSRSFDLILLGSTA